MKRSSSFVLVFLLAVVTLQGCSTVMAARQPSKKNLNVLAVGMSRDGVISELGGPISSETVNGQRVEIYKFVQGYSQGAKTVRTIGHGVADVFTLGLWEVVGTPTEAVFNGEEMAVKVRYDERDNVAEVTYLKAK